MFMSSKIMYVCSSTNSGDSVFRPLKTSKFRLGRCTLSVQYVKLMYGYAILLSYG